MVHLAASASCMRAASQERRRRLSQLSHCEWSWELREVKRTLISGQWGSAHRTERSQMGWEQRNSENTQTSTFKMENGPELRAESAITHVAALLSGLNFEKTSHFFWCARSSCCIFLECITIVGFRWENIFSIGIGVQFSQLIIPNKALLLSFSSTGTNLAVNYYLNKL